MVQAAVFSKATLLDLLIRHRTGPTEQLICFHGSCSVDFERLHLCREDASGDMHASSGLQASHLVGAFGFADAMAVSPTVARLGPGGPASAG